MAKKSKHEPRSDLLRAFGFVILPITLVYLGMYVTTLVMNANQSELDPSWVLSLGLEPLKATFPWSITGVLVIILMAFALKRRQTFWFLLGLTSMYAAIMLYSFVTVVTFTPSIYY